MLNACEKEIVDLHQFFQDWFNGELPKDGLSRFSDVMAEDFEMVIPSGALVKRPPLMTRIEAAFGVNKGTGYRIWIKNVNARALSDDLYSATYEEWQQKAGEEAKARISTVIFSKSSEAPNGLIWRHVHETWLPE